MTAQQALQIMDMLRARGVPENDLYTILHSAEGRALLASLPQEQVLSPVGRAPQPGAMSMSTSGAGTGIGQGLSFDSMPLGSKPPSASVMGASVGPPPMGMDEVPPSLPQPPATDPMDMMPGLQPLPAEYAQAEMDLGGSAGSARVPTPAERGVGGGSELPFQTFQRITGNKWTGGSSAPILAMLKELGIGGQAGSAETNLALKKALLSRGTNRPQFLDEGLNGAPQVMPRMPELEQELPLPTIPSSMATTFATAPVEAPQMVRPSQEMVRRRFLGLF